MRDTAPEKQKEERRKIVDYVAYECVCIGEYRGLSIVRR